AVLCPRFVVMREGRLIADTTPGEARGAIEGAIFEGTISSESYHQLLTDSERCLTQAYLVEGRNRVRVYQPEGSPPPGFAPVAPTLEDAYLVIIKTGGLVPAFLRGLSRLEQPSSLPDGIALDAATAERGAE